MHAPRAARLLAVAALLAGCAAAGPDYRAPRVSVPGAFGEVGGPAAAGEGASVPTGATALLSEWWTEFDDPTLDALVERAVRDNPNLRGARARVREARARRGGAAAEGLPTVDAAGLATRTRTSDTLSFLPGGTDNLFQAGFDASWEIDVFGGVRREVEAADAEIGAAVEDHRDALVSLLAEVARSYVDLRGAQRRAFIARESLAAQTETLELTRTRMAAGLATDLDVARAEAQVQSTASRIPGLEAEARRAIHLIGILLGVEPNALAADLSREGPIPAAPPEVPVGLPSHLLRRRPDVRRAERRLAAATARIGAASADLLPRFSLNGSFGLQSGESGDFLDSDSLAWFAGPAVRWAVLDFGRVRSRIAVEGAREEQAAAEFESTVLRSLREVEDAIVTFSREQGRRAALAAAVAANRRAVDLADILYREGSTDFLSVLQVERDLFDSEDDLAQSERDVASGLVALYKALGGGWETEALVEGDPGPPRGEPGRRDFDLSAAAPRGGPR